MSEQLGAVDVTGRGLLLSFSRTSDRYHHRIVLVDGEKDALPLLTSLEESGVDAAWPESPPLQQLHIEQRPAGRAAMLVGMAGRSHWSMSVQCHSMKRRLMFDVACRLEQPPVAGLGSTYALGALTPQWLDDSTVCLATAIGRVLLEMDSQSPPGIRWEFAVGRLRLAVPYYGDSFPTTVRWCYSVTLED